MDYHRCNRKSFTKEKKKFQARKIPPRFFYMGKIEIRRLVSFSKESKRNMCKTIKQNNKQLLIVYENNRKFQIDLKQLPFNTTLNRFAIDYYEIKENVNNSLPIFPQIFFYFANKYIKTHLINPLNLIQLKLMKVLVIIRRNMIYRLWDNWFSV